jgi:hypothetical protein
MAVNDITVSIKCIDARDTSGTAVRVYAAATAGEKKKAASMRAASAMMKTSAVAASFWFDAAC